MKVICHYRNDSDREINDPLPEKPWSFVFRLYSGDICSPMLRMFRKENWFSPPYPTRVWRRFVKWPVLPFIAWRLKNKGGYVGFKCYGADPVVYKEWMPAEDVYPGSQALTLSFRPFQHPVLALTDAYLTRRERFYYAIVANDPSQKRFEKGWANRLAGLRKECGL